MNIDFEVIGQISEIETIARGSSIRELLQLQARFGRGYWRKRKGVAHVRLLGGRIRLAEIHWYEAHGSGKVRTKIKRYLDRAIMETEKTEPRFAVCVNNAGYLEDLKVRSIYQVLPDEPAARSDYLRIIDETGEDYLYPANYFIFVGVPPEAVQTLLLAEA